MRLFMSLSEDEVKKFDRFCEKTGMTRSQCFKYFMNRRHDIRPPVYRYRELVSALDKIERDIKVIAMKDELPDDDRIFVMQKLADIKDMFMERFQKEAADGDKG